MGNWLRIIELVFVSMAFVVAGAALSWGSFCHNDAKMKAIQIEDLNNSITRYRQALEECDRIANGTTASYERQLSDFRRAKELQAMTTDGGSDGVIDEKNAYNYGLFCNELFGRMCADTAGN